MRFATLLALVACLAGAPAFGQEASPAQSRSALPAGAGLRADVSGWLRIHPAGGEPLQSKVADLLIRDPEAAPAIAAIGARCNCDQAASIALGVARAATILQKSNQESVRRIYATMARGCANCRALPHYQGDAPRDSRDPDMEAACRRRSARDAADDPTRIQPTRGRDCFCAMIASLTAQMQAQGEVTPRMGFYPDESGFAGFFYGPRFSGGAPVTNN